MVMGKSCLYCGYPGKGIAEYWKWSGEVSMGESSITNT